MRVLTYNVHSCIGADARLSPERVAAAIAQLHPDVVALQELDHRRMRSGQSHQARIIAESLTMDFHFHPALRIAEEEFGDAILSRLPLRLVQTGALPSVGSGWFLEKRGALWVEVEAHGRRWQILNTHLGLGRGERLRQAKALLGPEWAGAALLKPPLVLCGDFNSHTGGRVHALFSSALKDVQGAQACRYRTFPTRFPLLCLDHIFVGTCVGIGEVKVPRTALTRMASDHLPLVADLW